MPFPTAQVLSYCSAEDAQMNAEACIHMHAHTHTHTHTCRDTLQCIRLSGKELVTTQVSQTLVIPQRRCIGYTQLDQSQQRKCPMRMLLTPSMLIQQRPKDNVQTTVYIQNFLSARWLWRMMLSGSFTSACPSIHLIESVEPGSYETTQSNKKICLRGHLDLSLLIQRPNSINLLLILERNNFL